MFSKVFRIIVTCLVDGPVFRMFWNFQFIHQHSNLFWEHFKNILENFQDCSETFRFVFGTFQKVFRNNKIFSKSVLKYSDLFSECSETFSLFRNIKICFGKISKVFRNIKTFSEVSRNILTCLLNCPIFRMFWNFQFIPKHSVLFWKYFTKGSRTIRYFQKGVPRTFWHD